MSQQSDMEQLFKKIGKTQAKNQLATINDADLNRVRAFVVQSQRPLQAVRLLQKEREDRLIDEKFTDQKTQILAQAQTLDQNAAEFKLKQARMVQDVEADLEPALKSQLLRKKKDEDMEREQQKIKLFQAKIAELEEQINSRKDDLEHQQNQLDSHQKYTEFLESVVKNNNIGVVQGGDSKEGAGVEAMRSRFINLKNEHKKLIARRSQIDIEMENIKIGEQKQMQKLTNVLYDKSREMQELQRQIEELSNTNIELEFQFDNEINKKNSNNKNVGQVFQSINNIYSTVQRYHEIAPRRFKSSLHLTEEMRQNPKEHVGAYVGVLDESTNAINDLIRVAKKVTLTQKEMDALEADARAYERATEAAMAHSKQATDGKKDDKKANQEGYIGFTTVRFS